MAEEQKTRIINLAEKSAPTDGDFFAVDSQAGGSKKIPATALAKAEALDNAVALIQNPTKTLSGALCSFADGAEMPMVACTADIIPKQSGTGTPSPDNVRQISGWESVSVTVSPTQDAQDGTTTTTPLGRTVYGGTLDVVSGVLTVDRAMVTSNGTSNITQRRAGTSNSLFGIDLASGQGGKAVAETTLPNVIANELPLETAYNAWRNETPLVAMTSTGNTIWFRLPSITALADAKTYLSSNPLQVCYELATPQTYTLTGQEVETLLGQNNIWADSGDIEITYRRDISIVLENLENAING